MKKAKLIVLIAVMPFVWTTKAVIIGFEVADGFTVNGPWPSGWEPHASSGSTVAVTTNHPTEGSQGLELLAAAGGSAYVNYWVNLPIPLDRRTTISVDIVASNFSPPDEWNFSGYGNLAFYRQDYTWAGGLIFSLEDYDGYAPAQANDFHIYFLSGSSRELVGYFSPGVGYRYTVTIDRAAGTCAHRLDTLAGVLVAERTYSNSVSNIPLMSFTGSQNPGAPAYFDRLSIQVGPEPPVPATNLTIAVSGPNSRILGGQGSANSAYYVYATTNVTLPMSAWWLIGVTNSDGNGLIWFKDDDATNTQRFYRFGQSVP